jgi:predicted permease
MKQFWRRRHWDKERREELEAYLQMETEDNLARGVPPGEASAAARRKLGNSTRIREEIYRMNTIGFLDSLMQELRYGLRTLRHDPLFTIVAAATLAIGIGANTAVFSVVDAVLFKALPYPRSEQLVAVWHKAPGAPGLASVSGDLRLSGSMYLTYSDRNRSFQSLGVWLPLTANVTGLAEPEQVRTVLASDGALQALNVPALAGRWFSHAEESPGGPAAILLSYGYWQRHFGGDRSVIGRKLTVDSQLREIVGVMPRGFRFADTEFDLLVPVAFDRAKVILPGFGFQCVARLKPGVTIAQANADIARLVPVWIDSWPTAPGVSPHVYDAWRITPSIRPLQQDVVGGVSGVLWVLMGTIGIVMLIACANVANLMLVRAEGRQHELALRAALGAGSVRVVSGLWIESLLLAAAGGAAGIALAYGGLRWLVALGPGNLPRLGEISVDARALAFAFAISLLSGLLFGLVPAWKYAGPGISPALRGGGRTSSQSRERHRTRNVLVVAQVALALVLLVSAGLMIRTFQALRRVQPGFTHAENLQTLRLSIPPQLIAGPAQVARMQNNILDKLAAIPGVDSAGFASELPMEEFEHNWDVVVEEGHRLDAAQMPPLRVFESVSPDLLATMGTRLVAGRDLTWTDVYDRRHFVLVSDNLARELWGSASAAIGKRLGSIPGASVQEVAGVVQDVRINGVHAPAPATVYWPALIDGRYRAGSLSVERNVTIAIRSTRAGTAGFLDQIRQAVWSVNPSLPVTGVRTMREIYDKSLARTSFLLTMLAIAASMALTLGIVGIYGVISYAVSQRRREIGIRLALGAQQNALRRMFVRYGLGLAAIGVAFGAVAAVGLTRLMRSLLFGIDAADPLTYAAVALALSAAAALASYLPARRASGVDPAEVLRAE